MVHCPFCNNKITFKVCYNHICEVYFLFNYPATKKIHEIYYYYGDPFQPNYKYIINYNTNNTKIFTSLNNRIKTILDINTIRLISPENLEQTIELINDLS